FLRRHGAAADPRHGRPAGSDRLALDYHRACPALPEAAAELRSLQPERVAQDIKKRFVRVACLHGSWNPIDSQVIGRHRRSPAWSVARRSRSMQRSSTGVCAMDIALKQKSRRMDRGTFRKLLADMAFHCWIGFVLRAMMDISARALSLPARPRRLSHQ